MTLLTDKEFEDMLSELCNRNDTVKILLKKAGTFDKLPDNIKILIEKELGITSKKVFFKI
jgi:hypothetical protein